MTFANKTKLSVLLCSPIGEKYNWRNAELAIRFYPIQNTTNDEEKKAEAVRRNHGYGHGSHLRYMISDRHLFRVFQSYKNLSLMLLYGLPERLYMKTNYQVQFLCKQNIKIQLGRFQLKLLPLILLLIYVYSNRSQTICEN